MISNLELCELAASRQKYTLMNKRDEGDFEMERLERAFASVEWVNAYPFMPFKISPFYIQTMVQSSLTLNSNTLFGIDLFDLNMWLTHPS